MELENKTKRRGGCKNQRKEECGGASALAIAETAYCEETDRESCDDSRSIVSVQSDNSIMSSCRVELAPLPSKFWMKDPIGSKRPHDEDNEGSESASGDEALPAKKSVRKGRGRGRPPTSGKYVGLAKAQAELDALRREEAREDAQRKAEEEVAAQVLRHKANCTVALPEIEEDSGLASDLVKQVVEASEVILTVATKSGNLKGTFTKALKDSAASIKAAVNALYASTVSEETAKLQAENTRMRKEIAELRKELCELRGMLSRTQERMEDDLPSVNVIETTGSQSATIPAVGSNTADDLARSIMQQVGSMINARFEGVEDRLLPEKRIRPPLAADKRKEAASKQANVPEAEQQASQPPKSTKKAKAKANKGVAREVPAASQSQPRDLPPAPEVLDEGWSTVTKKGKKAKAVPKPTGTTASTGAAKEASRPPARPPKVKLRAPRTAAVVITLQPEAQEKGVTYATVMKEAKAKVNLESCGIASLRFRKAATGAHILEVSAGDNSNEKADSLAEKIRVVLDEKLARVSRPVKCAEFRVSGFDDSVSREDIAAAVAEHGGCKIETVKVGEIKLTYEGTGVTLVSCPVAAAKKVGQGGRLLVSWMSTRVEMVQPRPLRCYRCFQNGHVRVQCTAEVDRSEECYRCGQAGHKSSTCSATPRCSICAAANKPSAHRLGSKVCAAPKGRKGRAPGPKNSSTTTPPAATSCPPSQTGAQRAHMETS